MLFACNLLKISVPISVQIMSVCYDEHRSQKRRKKKKRKIITANGHWLLSTCEHGITNLPHWGAWYYYLCFTEAVESQTGE